MTRKLILMRHAKSDWDDPTLSDKERILNPRGRQSAAALGDWLRAKNLAPDLALISSSQRTRETWDLLGLDCEHLFLDPLYHASADRIETVIQTNGNEAQTVLLIAHNPGIGSYANHLQRDTKDPDFARYPTGATAVFNCEITNWSKLHATNCHLADFITPRQLTK